MSTPTRRLRVTGRRCCPRGLTPHSLRRTFASLLFAVGEAPPYVMRQMGHTQPTMTLGIYAREMDRRDGEPERLRALVNGAESAPTGTKAPEGRSEGIDPGCAEDEKDPAGAGLSGGSG